MSAPLPPKEFPRLPHAAQAAEDRGLDGHGHVLLVEDEALCRESWRRALEKKGYRVSQAEDAERAIEQVTLQSFDAIVSDIHLPGIDGLSLMAQVRLRDLDVPIILVTADASLSSAIKAVEYGALRYLPKPIALAKLNQIVGEAVLTGRLARKKRHALYLVSQGAPGPAGLPGEELANHNAKLDWAMGRIWMDYQPIVSFKHRAIYGFEALVRNDATPFERPEQLLDLAERCDRLYDLGRAIRQRIAATLDQAPADTAIFVNLHPQDLLDESLYRPENPLSTHAHRIVLEITERAALSNIGDIKSRVELLRKLGYRIAIDDLGSGYSDLTLFASLEPDVVKLDMALVRDVDSSLTKQKLIGALISLARELGVEVVSEGVETALERDMLVDLTCDLLQGYFFARPGPSFKSVIWR